MSIFPNYVKSVRQYLNNSRVEYSLQPFQVILEKINRFRNEFASLEDDQLKGYSQCLRQRAEAGESLDVLLPRAFALTREVISRTLNLQPYDCQIMGGIALHQGKLVEMQTGEGKTLMAVFPAYLNALTDQGVHILTFNDYLARRDAEWMRPVYAFLALSVDAVYEGMTERERRKAYGADVTYLTAKEAGFDYLRDALCYHAKEQVHRHFYYAIIDEADSILIDEARIPLVIAGSTTEDELSLDVDTDIQLLIQMAGLVRQLDRQTDIRFDRYARTVHLTDQGLRRAETLLGIEDLYADSYLYSAPFDDRSVVSPVEAAENAGFQSDRTIEGLARLNCALYAEFLVKKDVDYIVRYGVVELVDEFTGRIAERRRWPDGIQEAIEAKEGLTIQSQGRILNSIALQYFLRLYSKTSGMSATAKSAEKELRAFYGLDVVVIPPNRPCIRQDFPDRIFRTKMAKQKAIIEEIVHTHQTGRPILVGTATVEESAQYATALQHARVACQILNAKRDEHEAQIIANAGRLGAVTISTNMAGRGTDIRLGGADENEKEEVARLGGLYVIGTNKHESPRLDKQLRGRAGRQGDPGSSIFFISIEDDLFAKYQLTESLSEAYLVCVRFENRSFPQPLQERANSGFQTELSIPDQENEELTHPKVRQKIDHVHRIIIGQNLEIKKTLVKYSYLLEQQRQIVNKKRISLMDAENALTYFHEHAHHHVLQLQNVLEREELAELCRLLLLSHLDRAWSYHLEDVADIREGIYLFRVGQLDPLQEFHRRLIGQFEHMWQNFELEVIRAFLDIHSTEPQLMSIKAKLPSATWTYLVNDDPFEGKFRGQFLKIMGNAIDRGLRLNRF
ncbi:MAG: DEAD/DEAH box helicase [Chloroflexota bacterium]